MTSQKIVDVFIDFKKDAIQHCKTCVASQMNLGWNKM